MRLDKLGLAHAARRVQAGCHPLGGSRSGCNSRRVGHLPTSFRPVGSAGAERGGAQRQAGAHVDRRPRRAIGTQRGVAAQQLRRRLHGQEPVCRGRRRFRRLRLPLPWERRVLCGLWAGRGLRAARATRRDVRHGALNCRLKRVRACDGLLHRTGQTIEVGQRPLSAAGIAQQRHGVGSRPPAGGLYDAALRILARPLGLAGQDLGGGADPLGGGALGGGGAAAAAALAAECRLAAGGGASGARPAGRRP
mmetsp:Transcript_1273/g.3817  ORF Transcript_1273/g.3817 Transcript_1273/m.3817 type:complete len:250 (-) Transcript_1273:1437-2186(-)